MCYFYAVCCTYSVQCVKFVMHAVLHVVGGAKRSVCYVLGIVFLNNVHCLVCLFLLHVVLVFPTYSV